MTSARQLIDALGLEKHPEGGWYRETWRAASQDGARASGSAIYYLLPADEFSHWHRLDADEIWHFHAGAPLSLTLSPNGCDAEAHLLGPDVLAGQKPQVLAPRGWWQCATTVGAWTLVSCTVSPGFVFEGFEMAPPDWRPTPRRPSGG